MCVKGSSPASLSVGGAGVLQVQDGMSLGENDVGFRLVDAAVSIDDPSRGICVRGRMLLAETLNGVKPISAFI